MNENRCEFCDGEFASPRGVAVHRARSHESEVPWYDGELMERLYLEEELSTNEMAERLGCDDETIRMWLGRHGIELRSRSEALKGVNRVERAYFYTDVNGYENLQSWGPEGKSNVRVHRLLAVSEYGFDAVCGNVVHHGAGAEGSTTPWDNRPENISVMSHEDHLSLHATINSDYYVRGEK